LPLLATKRHSQNYRYRWHRQQVSFVMPKKDAWRFIRKEELMADESTVFKDSAEVATRPVSVTAEARRHPALELLARAAIALARSQLATRATAPGDATATTKPAQEAQPRFNAGGSEVHHG
jgi:hypothetical protein